MLIKVRNFQNILILIFLCYFLSACTSAVQPPMVSPGTAFSIAIFSDPEVFAYPRLDGVCRTEKATAGTCAKKPGETKEACAKRCSVESNLNQLYSIKHIQQLKWPEDADINVGRPVRKVVAALVNGDLTSAWRVKERQGYINFYQKAKSSLPKMPLFFGLGNNDYYANACQCRDYLPYDMNACARDAVDTMRETYQGKNSINFDPVSLSYSFDIGDFHVVQLNLNPFYAVDLNSYDDAPRGKACMKALKAFKVKRAESDRYKISDAYEWLSRDLSHATARNKYTILNMHAPGDGDGLWGPREDYAEHDHNKKYFADLLKKSNVVGVFGGFVHAEYGYMGDYKLNGSVIRNVFGNTIPWFRSGASEYSTYLLVELGSPKAMPASYMNVGVVSSRDKKPTFIRGTNKAANLPMTFRLR